MTAPPPGPPAAGLDRVLEVEPGARGAAVRNVTSTMSILDTHFPRMPVLPGVLLLGDMVAVAALVAPGGGWELGSARRVRFRRFVRPGDQVVIEVRVIGVEEDRVLVRATARVDGAVVATARELVLVRTGVGG